MKTDRTATAEPPRRALPRRGPRTRRSALPRSPARPAPTCGLRSPLTRGPAPSSLCPGAASSGRARRRGHTHRGGIAGPFAPQRQLEAECLQSVFIWQEKSILCQWEAGGTHIRPPGRLTPPRGDPLAMEAQGGRTALAPSPGPCPWAVRGFSAGGPACLTCPPGGGDFPAAAGPPQSCCRQLLTRGKAYKSQKQHSDAAPAPGTQRYQTCVPCARVCAGACVLSPVHTTVAPAHGPSCTAPGLARSTSECTKCSPDPGWGTGLAGPPRAHGLPLALP